MELPDYVQALCFRFAHPEHARSKAFRLAMALLQRIGLPLDELNTRLPCEHAETRRKIRLAGRTNVFAVAAIINRAAGRLSPDESFVALGIGNGFPLLAAIAGNPAKRCIGVDESRGSESGASGDLETFRRQFATLRTANHSVHERPVSDYLDRWHDGPIGFCFVGAPTSADAVDRLVLAEPHLAENALVFVENANVAAVRDGSLAFIDQSQNQYRMLLDRRAPHHGELTLGSGILLFQLLGRNKVAAAAPREKAKPLLVPAA